MPSDSKTKIRPQQSCQRCRERKVKCDRSIPCHACIIRGLEAECTYLTTPEDRAHISQSEIIDQLRREVAQLRGRLDQSPREPGHSKRPSQNQLVGKNKSRRQNALAHTGYSYGNAEPSGHSSGLLTSMGAGSSARATPDASEGSWRGSSPSSSAATTMSSAIVTSPDSTGSENGAPPSSISSRSASASVSAYPVGTGYAPQIGELDGSITGEQFAFRNSLADLTTSFYHPGGMTFAPGDISSIVTVPVQGLPMHELHSQDTMLGAVHRPLYGADNTQYLLDGSKDLQYSQNTHYHAPSSAPTTHYGGNYPISNEYDGHRSYHQWEVDSYGNPNPNLNQFPQIHSFHTPAHLSTIDPFMDTNVAAANTNINAYTDPHFPLTTPTFVTSDTSSHASPSSQDRPSPTAIMSSMPSSWKGEGKKELLEILLETIGSCDEEHLPQVIHVLRTSPSPEEAVSGVCRVLGLGNGNWR